MFDSVCRKSGDILRSDLRYNDSGLEREKAKVRLAALLHDVGHSPFSHAGEEVMPLETNETRYPHESYSAAIISELMFQVIGDHPINQTNYHITAKEIADFLNGDVSAGTSLVWRPLVTGQLDADRGDYLLRERVLVTLTLVRDENGNPVIGVEEGGWHAAEGLILARYMMFTQVYFHHVRRAYDHHIGQALSHALASGLGLSGIETPGFFPAPTSVDNLQRYLEWDDWRVLGLIHHRDAGEHGEIIRKRTHHRNVFSTPEVPDLRDLERLEDVVKILGPMVAFVDAAEKSWYSIGDRDLQIKPEDSQVGKPLSEYSTIIKGLIPVNQQRVYVSYGDQEDARVKVQSLINES
jgi:HD superfamily phosphohydrolase